MLQVGRTTEAVKTTRLSQFLQEVFRADTDLHTLRVAALTLGRLVKAGGPVTAEVVDSEVHPLGPKFVATLAIRWDQVEDESQWCTQRKLVVPLAALHVNRGTVHQMPPGLPAFVSSVKEVAVSSLCPTHVRTRARASVRAEHQGLSCSPSHGAPSDSSAT